MIISAPELTLEAFTITDVPSSPEPFRLVNRIPIRDNGEPLVDLRITNPELSFGVYCLPYVRESVAHALTTAYRKMPSHLDLRIGTALRTLEQQAEMYWSNYRRAKEEHPNWPESTVRRVTNRFFAPPDAKAPPGHCTGAAVDVGLIDRDSGEWLDVRSPLEGWNGAPTAVAGLSPESAENRRLLCFIMHSAGLSNCRDEFWHWSYGDSAWAVRVGAGTACYGLVEPPDGATRVTGPKLELVPYDPSWPSQFLELRHVIAAKLGCDATRIEHVGSTAVPGLASQPILDIDVVVADEDTALTATGALTELGYALDGSPEAHDAPKVEPARRWPSHRVRILCDGAPELTRDLRLREHLRSNESSSARFGERKAILAAQYPWDRIRYDEAKRSFLASFLG